MVLYYDHTMRVGDIVRHTLAKAHGTVTEVDSYSEWCVVLWSDGHSDYHRSSYLVVLDGLERMLEKLDDPKT